MPLVEGGKSSPTLEQSGEGASNARTVSKRQEAIHPPIACSVQQDGRARAPAEHNSGSLEQQFGSNAGGWSPGPIRPQSGRRVRHFVSCPTTRGRPATGASQPRR